LRYVEPDLERPFKIPGGNTALILLVLPPLSLIGFIIALTLVDHSVTLWGFDRFGFLGLEIGWYGLAGMTAILSGPLVYRLFYRRTRLPDKTASRF